MFDSVYKVRYANKIKHPTGQYILHILTFRCRFNQQYIIHVEQYDHHVFGVKFHLKSHRDSDRKYSLLTGFNDPFRILATIVHAMKDFANQFPLASFVFFGAELEGESTVNTKRFRVYVPIMEYFFPLDKYDHQLLEEESFYIMINVEHNQQNPKLYPYIVDTFNLVIGKPDKPE